MQRPRLVALGTTPLPVKPELVLTCPDTPEPSRDSGFVEKMRFTLSKERIRDSLICQLFKVFLNVQRHTGRLFTEKETP